MNHCHISRPMILGSAAMRLVMLASALALGAAAAYAQAPTITTLSPNAATAGGGAFVLTVNGTNFTENSVVQWNGASRPTTFVRSTQLRANITAADISATGTASVTVFNPTLPGTSNSVTFNIVSSPVARLFNLTPSSRAAGTSGFTLVVSGTNFVSGDTVQWNGQARTTFFFSAITLEATIPSSDVAAPGLVDITVATTGGTISNTLVFSVTVTLPPPTITSLDPDSVAAGGPSFTLTVNGTNFTGTSRVRWNGSERATTFVNGTTLSAVIPAGDIDQPGTANVTVVETAPGGGTSNTAVFTIDPFSSLFFPQMAVGGGYSTVFSVNSTGAGTATGNLNLTDQQGRPFVVDLAEVSPGQAAPGASDRFRATGSSFPIVLDPGVMKVFTATPLSTADPTKSGHARIDSSGGSLHGVATFKLRQGGTLKTTAGVLATRPTEFATIPIDNSLSERRFMGFSVANTSTQPINIKIVTLNEAGAVLDTVNPPELNPLQAGWQATRFLHEIIPARTTFRGTLVMIVQGQRRMVVVALVEEEGLFSAIPVILEKPANVPD